MKRLAHAMTFAAVSCGAALAQNSATPSAVLPMSSNGAGSLRQPMLKWNPHQTLLLKGTIKGIQQSARMADGKSWVSLLVKLSNGGTALVELGPQDYVDAQGLRFRMRSEVWVAGSKVFAPNGDSVILAERLRYDEMRPSFRRPDGKPFWEH